MIAVATPSRAELLRKADWAHRQYERYCAMATAESAKPSNGDWRRAKARDAAVRHLRNEASRFLSIEDAYRRKAEALTP